VNIKQAWVNTYYDFMSDTDRPRKLYWGPAAASLIPGFGQWMKGQNEKAVSLFPVGVLFFLLGIILWPFKILLSVTIVFSVVEALLHEP